jgi:putative SOS response-associated peptidase YedK
MCGRFHRFASIQEIATKFNAKPRGELLAPPNYNAAPQDWHPVIRLNENGEREIVNMRWGFLSKEAKTEKASRRPSMRAPNQSSRPGPSQRRFATVAAWFR